MFSARLKTNLTSLKFLKIDIRTFICTNLLLFSFLVLPYSVTSQVCDAGGGCTAGQTCNTYCYDKAAVNVVAFEFAPSVGMAAKSTIKQGSFFATTNDNLTVYSGASGSGIGGAIVFGPSSGNLAGSVIVSPIADESLIFVVNSIDLPNLNFSCVGGFELELEVCSESIAAGGNAPPTASNFTASDGPYEDIVYAFSTSDFGYNDSNGDPLDHLLITLIRLGTLFIDSDNNNMVNGAEALSDNSQVSKADLDAGRLKYLYNDANTTSFEFKVNDGTVNSGALYTAILTIVGIPNRVNISNPREDEGLAASPGILKFVVQLSNVYGDTVSVDYVVNDSTALVSDNDYIDASGTLTINPGSISDTIKVTIIGDNIIEPDDTLTVVLSNPINATFGLGSNIIGLGIISNDDMNLNCTENEIDVTTAYLNTILSPGDIQAILRINSDGTIQDGDQYTFKAKDSIILLSNFEVELGGIFTAIIEECPSAILDKITKLHNNDQEKSTMEGKE